MELSKSKLALAKVINENGGWHGSDVRLFSTQSGDGVLKFWESEPKTLKGCVCTEWSGGCWHQTILSREEYYQAYPKADADGWIEWNGGECPVEKGLMVDIRVSDGREERNLAANTLTKGRIPDASCAFWKNDGMAGDIIAYRPHKPEVKPELCESVMRSIPEPDAKPTIEQLAQDYRNKLDFAKRKQQEADDAKVAADAALGELERAGEALGLLIGIANPDREPELVITDWRDLRANDVIFVDEYDEHESGEYVVIELEDRDYGGGYAVKTAGIDGNGMWIDTAREWRFIRRP